ncbi:LolA-like outer membrane lipoprotein chaperone [Arcobacter arenosus]|uniref:Cell envelope biogenesis protein LolA n=1 Tax=Arcobacter arenosus TaxID=2576037 RepID=A0A5R8XY89_9BACT|nr:LolA-like outer membrane lipoprotein chaperone [Arcobacter arenosus]TLP36186.1 cell envelope biogenesis protein LolA [Arcobacter arenosus]
MVYRVFLVTVMLLSFSFAAFDKGNIKSFEADFLQIVTNESGKKIEYKGQVFIKNNGKVLWKYFEPVKKNVYLINDLVIVDEPELEQAIYTKLEKNIDIIKLLKDAKQIETNLYESFLYDVKYLIKIQEDNISSLSYKDELANSIEIKFLNIKQNIDIDEKTFQFLAPDYYDIIEK